MRGSGRSYMLSREKHSNEYGTMMKDMIQEKNLNIQTKGKEHQ